MQKFDIFEGLVVPLDRSNVDTDAIIPKQYLKSIKRSGLGPYLFDDWRYLDAGDLMQDNSKRRPNSDFVLNEPRYQGATILLARDNFGCGSSREHAVWSMMDYGLRAVVAASFGDIFYNNSVKNGLLAVTLDSDSIDTLLQRTRDHSGYRLKIDLPQQQVSDQQSTWQFEISEFDKRCLIEGLDQIALTLEHADKIRAFEARRKKITPWLYTE